MIHADMGGSQTYWVWNRDGNPSYTPEFSSIDISILHTSAACQIIADTSAVRGIACVESGVTLLTGPIVTLLIVDVLVCIISERHQLNLQCTRCCSKELDIGAAVSSHVTRLHIKS